MKRVVVLMLMMLLSVGCVKNVVEKDSVSDEFVYKSANVYECYKGSIVIVKRIYIDNTLTVSREEVSSNNANYTKCDANTKITVMSRSEYLDKKYNDIQIKEW